MEDTAAVQRDQQESPGTTTTTEQERTRQPQPQQAPSDDHADEESDDDRGEEFEFPFVSRDSPAGTAVPADELFADGRIRPFSSYPALFGHTTAGTAAAQQPAHHHHPTPPPRERGKLGRLFLEESRARNSSTSSSEEEGGGGLGGAPPESYCLWTPGSPRRRRKSGSTGSVARWRRISELVVGRSRSDGKERFMLFPLPPPPQPKGAAGARQRLDDEPGNSRMAKGGVGKAEVDAAAAAHRAAVYGAPRRTFLPYREELVGLFANVNGVSRSHHQYPL